jgi:hypothetical protein
METQIKKALQEVNDGTFINLHLSNDAYHEMKGPRLTKCLIGRKSQIIYITSKTPSIKLQKGMSKKTRDSIFFIDMVGGSGSVFSKEEKNTLYTATERSLTELGISVFSLEKFKNKKKLIVLDSIPSLVEKNGLESVVNFLRFLRERIESSGDSGLLLSLYDQEQELLNLIDDKFFHKTIKLDG